MPRHHSNFIKAFTEYHKDGFVPDQFYVWSAISLVATVLERKVWTPWVHGNVYPNMFIFLVAKPGMGKSSAMKKSYKMMQKMNKDYGTFVRMLPNKVTEPKLLDLMRDQEYFMYNNKQCEHTSLFYYASEGAACFHDVYGGLVQTLTALYDCDDLSKATVSRAEEVKITNPCINILAGCTFDFLGKLLTTEGIMGGFASRITYVVQDEMINRTSTWLGNSERAPSGIDYFQLLADLKDIHSMVGGFDATPEFVETYKEWFPKFDKQLQETQNEKMQALMVRKSAAMTKLPMILCAAESSDLVLKKSHWDWALALMNKVEDKIPGMIREGQAGNTKSQSGINSALMKYLKSAPAQALTEGALVAQATLDGHRGDEVTQTIRNLIRDGQLLALRSGKIHLVGDPNLHI